MYQIFQVSECTNLGQPYLLFVVCLMKLKLIVCDMSSKPLVRGVEISGDISDTSRLNFWQTLASKKKCVFYMNKCTASQKKKKTLHF